MVKSILLKRGAAEHEYSAGGIAGNSRERGRKGIAAEMRRIPLRGALGRRENTRFPVTLW